MKKIIVLIWIAVGGFFATLRAQEIALKTNLLYDATTTMNLGVEFGLSPQWTLDVAGNYNPWTFTDDRKIRHWLTQAELRYWPCRKFNGHFWGFHEHFGAFDAGGMLPWGFKTGKMLGMESSTLRDYRYEAWFVGAGVSYGYHWLLGNRWGLEATLGLGYTYLNYDKFRCGKCGEKLNSGTKHYVGPTKAGITLIYMIK